MIELVTVPVIAVLCYVVVEAVKATKRVNSGWYPAIAAIAGIVLGIAALFTHMPGFPATDLISAAAVGAVSGLAATGGFEMVSKLVRK